jgi:putative ubiquitin-RnfH superfamily antitoxin RatB of RatAB toxin-antitoxin module
VTVLGLVEAPFGEDGVMPRGSRYGKEFKDKAEVDAGERTGVTSEESVEPKRLRRKNAELRRA